MLKIFKKRTKLDQILNKKFTNVSELHEKLSQMGIKYETHRAYTLKQTFYLLRIDEYNYACKLRCDTDNRVYLVR